MGKALDMIYFSEYENNHLFNIELNLLIPRMCHRSTIKERKVSLVLSHPVLPQNLVILHSVPTSSVEKNAFPVRRFHPSINE